MASHEPLTPFQNAVSGSLGALFANTLVFPLDVIKTRMQVQPHRQLQGNSPYYKSVPDAFLKILNSEGITGLYSGIFAGLSGTVLQNFAYFYCYGLIRGGYAKTHAHISTGMELFLGGLSGAASQFFTLPIAVVTTRQQTTPAQEKLSFRDTIVAIVQEDGIQGLWKGLRASLVLCINPAITYGAFERLKAVLLTNSDSASVSSMEAFTIGALSKTLATIVTYPYIMAKVRLQYKPPKSMLLSEIDRNRMKFSSAIDVLRRVVNESGIMGLYKGMETQITKAVLCQAILFSLKEQFNVWTVFLFALFAKRKIETLSK